MKLEPISDKVYSITDMIEKPTLETKFSNFSILGRCVLTPEIFDILSEMIEDCNSSILQLEELYIQTDFKLLLLNLRSEDLGRQVSPISSKDNLNMINHTVIVDSKIYELLKKKITRNAYSTRESMQVMLDVYYFSERITKTEYEELTELLV